MTCFAAAEDGAGCGGGLGAGAGECSRDHVAAALTSLEAAPPYPHHLPPPTPLEKACSPRPRSPASKCTSQALVTPNSIPCMGGPSSLKIEEQKHTFVVVAWTITWDDLIS